MIFKTKTFIFGLPLFETAVTLAISLTFSLLINDYQNSSFIIALLVSWVYAIKLKREMPFSLRSSSNYGVILRVAGLPDDFYTSIDMIIEDNKLVVITCPKDPMFRFAIKEHIYNKLGFVEFNDGDRVTVTSKQLGHSTFLLSYRDKVSLQNAISSLMKRGWKFQGEQGTESSLFDRVYTQTMIYYER